MNPSGPADRHAGADHPRPRRGRHARDRRGDLRRALATASTPSATSLLERTRALMDALPALPAALAGRPSVDAILKRSGSTARPRPTRSCCGRSIERAREPRPRRRDHGARATGRPRACSSGSGSRYESFGSHGGAATARQGRGARRPQRRAARAGRGGAALRPRASPTAPSTSPSSAPLLRIPQAQMQDYEFAGPAAQARLARGAPRDRPRRDPARAAAAAGAARRASCSATRASRRTTTSPTSSPTRPCSRARPRRARRRRDARDDGVLVVVRPPPETSAYHADNPLYERRPRPALRRPAPRSRS